MNQAPTYVRMGIGCFFWKKEGCFCLWTVDAEKAACPPLLMMNQAPTELTIGPVNAMKRNYYGTKRRALCQPIFTSSLLISSS
jgi:hypothetical protein